MDNGNESAYPLTEDSPKFGPRTWLGLTKREYFAAMTLIVGSSLVYWLFLSATDVTDIAYMVMIGLLLIGLCCLRVK